MYMLNLKLFNRMFKFQISNRVHKYCEIAAIIQLLQASIAPFMFNIVPIYSNYKKGMFSSEKPENGTFEHSVAYALPFEHNNEFWYTIICLYNFFVSFNLSNVFCCHDLLICLIVFHIWGHLDIFENNLNTFPKPSPESNGVVPLRYSYEENKLVAQRLKETVQYYIMIKE